MNDEEEDDSSTSTDSDEQEDDDSGGESSSDSDDDDTSTASDGSTHDSTTTSSAPPPPPPPPPPKKPKKLKPMYVGKRDSPDDEIKVDVHAPVVVSQEKIEKRLKKAEDLDRILQKIDDDMDDKRNAEIRQKILEAEQLEREHAAKAKLEAEKAVLASLNVANERLTPEQLKYLVNQEAARMEGSQPRKRGMMDGMNKDIYGNEEEEAEGEVRIEKNLLMDLLDPIQEERRIRRERRAKDKEEKKRLKLEIKRKKKMMKNIQKKIKKKKKQQNIMEKLQILTEGECNMPCIILHEVHGNIDPEWERKLQKIAIKNQYRRLTDKERSIMRKISKIDPMHLSKLPKIKKKEKRHNRRSSKSSKPSKASKSKTKQQVALEKQNLIPEDVEVQESILPFVTTVFEDSSFTYSAPMPAPETMTEEELREQQFLAEAFAQPPHEGGHGLTSTYYDTHGVYDEEPFFSAAGAYGDYDETAFQGEGPSLAARGYEYRHYAASGTSDSIAGSSQVTDDLRYID